MTPITHSRQKTAPPREEKYLFALREYISDGSEAARGQAYELGRLFLADGISLIEFLILYVVASRILAAPPSPPSMT